MPLHLKASTPAPTTAHSASKAATAHTSPIPLFACTPSPAAAPLLDAAAPEDPVELPPLPPPLEPEPVDPDEEDDVVGVPLEPAEDGAATPAVALLPVPGPTGMGKGAPEAVIMGREPPREAAVPLAAG